MRDLRELMETWATWRHNGPGAIHALGYGDTVIGRMRDGMPSTKCTICDGSGHVPGWKIGSSMAFVSCVNCSGYGKIVAKSSLHKINPAFVSSTHIRGDNDIISPKIDMIVASWKNQPNKQLCRQVIYHEYCDRRGGLQIDKANRLGRGFQVYRNTLVKAHKIIAKKINRYIGENENLQI